MVKKEFCLSVVLVLALFFSGHVSAAGELNYQVTEYGLGENRFAQISSLGFANYKEGNEFKPVDMTLIDYGSSWKTTKSVYYPSIPKYADEWSEFNNVYKNNDHSISVKPAAGHIGGVLVKHNVILYQDAFGDSIDLEVTAYPSHLLRKIIIKKPQAEAMHFDFEINIDKFLDYKSVDSKRTKALVTVGLNLKRKSVEFNESKGKGKSPTTIYPMKVWDSNIFSPPEYIDYKLYEKDGKLYFRKEISKEFLENAVYPVYTDDDTGVQSPGAAESYAVGECSGDFWIGLDDVKTSDDLYVRTYLVGDVSDCLKATDFGFSVPLGAAIDGVIVEYERYAANAIIEDNLIKLVVGGVVVGDNNSAGATWQLSDDDTYVSFGASNYVWGATLTPTNVDAVDFGAVLQHLRNNFPMPPFYNAWVDHVRIAVYYTPDTTPPDCTQFTVVSAAFGKYNRYKNGDVVNLGVECDEIGLTVTFDLLDIDDQNVSDFPAIDDDDNSYSISHTVSPLNGLEKGLKTVSFRACDIADNCDILPTTTITFKNMSEVTDADLIGVGRFFGYTFFIALAGLVGFLILAALGILIFIKLVAK